jgi:6,7-dimethyl-8-ribityllumazine synthase
VPGCYELPFVANLAFQRSDCDFLVAVGYIERGETLHGEVMGHVVSRALVDLSLKHEKPIGLGIIGPGATLDQANKRKEEYARAAVRAALACLSLHSGPSVGSGQRGN